MSEEIKDFNDCINLATGKKHLMLGNGFSRSLFNDIFNYVKLAEKITNSRIQKIFNDIDTTDFEFVMYKLVDAIKIISLYDKEGSIIKEIKQDEEELKKILISVITESHPPNPSSITDEQYLSAYDFLAHFEEGRKYTFNYDLLLYWVYMHFMDGEEKKLKSDDGFRTDHDTDNMVTWEIGREHKQNLYYLHGAMHIFKSYSAVIEKFTWKNTGIAISDQVRKAIDDDKFPVFISEGTTEHKLKRIKENGYLSRAFSSLKSIKGNLFIYGHSIRDEDDHVFDYVNNNIGLKKVFISLFGSADSDGNQKIIKKVNKWRIQYSDKKYVFYDSNSAQVWDK